MRGSKVVLALAMTLFAARATHAQDTTQTSSTDKQCIQKTRGNASDSGVANRADPTLQGNKDCAPPSVGHATISGAVFFDLDLNGVFGSDEVGLSSWTVQLTGPNVSQTASTDVNGAYSFSGLSSGTYTVCVTILPGWTQTGPASGASCLTGTGYTINVPSLAVDTLYTGKDFGFISQ
ncbi:MAG TPA: SdrD B-like domain-containing protein [Gemmatimonadaceae bacterium]|nr:SdrD B-like domain-containing protein [Gemmatimonadaceae bacterium]